jgi:hypothetical protein
MNTVISTLPQQWISYCHNGGYLFYPFCKSRSIGEIIAFNIEDRGKLIPTIAVDRYAGDAIQSPHGVDITKAYLDRLGYYAETQQDA